MRLKRHKIVLFMAKLIKNKPCNADLFEGKSHEHLAEVIAKHIKALAIVGKEFPDTANMVARNPLIRHKGHTS